MSGAWAFIVGVYRDTLQAEKQMASLLSLLNYWTTLMFASFGDYGYMSVVKKLTKHGLPGSSC